MNRDDTVASAEDILGDTAIGPILRLGSAMLRAASNLPEDDEITEEERRLVVQLEQEVDQAFGPGTSLHGRAVALYAIRDLAGGSSSEK